MTTTTVRHWTSNNDANHRNRHAEALGVEFFAFPYQSLRARVGNRSGQVSDSFLIKEGDSTKSVFIAQRYSSRPQGRSECVEQKRFDTQDEALLGAAEWVKGGV